MPIPSGENRQPMSMKKCDVAIERRYDLVPIGYGKAATGKKIILYIHENQGIASGEINLYQRILYQSIIIHKKLVSI